MILHLLLKKKKTDRLKIVVICIFIILIVVFSRTDHDAAAKYKIITKEGYKWQLQSELPCLGEVPDFPRVSKSKDNGAEGKDSNSGAVEAAIKRYKKCDDRNPESVADSSLIRDRGYYNINFASCLENLKIKNETGKGLTLETTCNWYWCASLDGCVRLPRPNPGSTCTTSEKNIMIGIFVPCMCIAFFGGVVWYQDTMNKVKKIHPHWMKEHICFCFSGQFQDMMFAKMLSSFLVIFVFVVPAVVLFSIAISECDQVYPFPMIYELFNQTNFSTENNSIIYLPDNQTETPFSAPTPSPTTTLQPTSSPSVKRATKNTSSSNDFSIVLILMGVGMGFVLCIALSTCKPHEHALTQRDRHEAALRAFGGAPPARRNDGTNVELTRTNHHTTSTTPSISSGNTTNKAPASGINNTNASNNNASITSNALLAGSTVEEALC